MHLSGLIVRFHKLAFAAKFYFLKEWKKNVAKCPECGGESLENYYSKREGFIFVNLKKCSNCNFVLQSPRLSDVALENYYKKSYRLMRPSDNMQHQFEREKRKGRNYSEIISRYFKDYKNLNILEIGSARGGILQFFKEKGAVVQGLEWDEGCREFANKIGVKTNIHFEELENKKFDLVILSHVLEHVHSYFDLLKKIDKHLNESGRVFISVPGRENFDRSVQLAHLYYFEEASLNKICKRVWENCLYSDSKINVLYQKGQI